MEDFLLTTCHLPYMINHYSLVQLGNGGKSYPFSPRLHFNLVIRRMLFPEEVHVSLLMFGAFYFRGEVPIIKLLLLLIFLLIHEQDKGFFKTILGSIIFLHVAKAVGQD